MLTRATVTILQPDAEVPLDRMTAWLMRAGATLRGVPLWSTPPPSLADAGDGLVLLGGTGSCHDVERYRWLPEVKDLLVDAVGAGLPVFAICLGHQILAEAFGGTVTVDAQDCAEEGPVDVEWLAYAAGDPVLGPISRLAGWAVLPQSHHDAVTELPPDALHLARSTRCAHQAFRVGSALGVQFHPEASPDLAASWSGDDALAVRGALRAVDTAVKQSGRLIAEGFMDQVLAHADPRPGRGRATRGPAGARSSAR